MNSLASAASEQQFAALYPAPDPEWEFLRTAVSDPQRKLDRLRTLSTGLRWRVLFDLAERHGVHPLLYRALSTADILVPASDMRRLAQLHQTNLHKSMLMARELIHLLDVLAKNNIEVLIYKGLALAESAYGDIALRQMGDIDLLIHGRDLSRIREAVRPLGYVPHSALSPAEEQASLRSGYEYVFDGPAGHNLLELKWDILPRFYSVDFDHNSFFRRAVKIKVAGHQVRTPSPEDLFLILSVHAAKHVWGNLIWLCDLARIMRQPQLDWAWIGAQARLLGIVRIMRVTLMLANTVLHVEIPDAADRNLPPDAEAGRLAQEIAGYMAAATAYNPESFAYFRLMLRLREKRRDRVRFISRLILTPGPGEWAAVRLPEPLFPLYRLVRFGRLTGRIIGR